MTNKATSITLESLFTVDVKQVQFVFSHFHVPGFHIGVCRVKLFSATAIAKPNKNKFWTAFHFHTSYANSSCNV